MTLHLIKKENDFALKKVHEAKWYRDEVGKALELDEDHNPSLRSYEVLLNVLRKKMRELDPLEKPWSIGVCEANQIPDSAIPMLIEYKEISLRESQMNRIKPDYKPMMGPLTIRKARWMAKLAACVEPMAREIFPHDRQPFIALTSAIAERYSNAEHNSILLNKDPETFTFDTNKIDTLIFCEPHATLDQLIQNIDRVIHDYEFQKTGCYELLGLKNKKKEENK
jgi:hypothetical protein